MRKRRVWLAWIPAILMMFIIFRFSSENGTQSSSLSGSLTETVVEAVINGSGLSVTSAEAARIIEIIHTPIRKLGHLTEYALFGMTVSFALVICHHQKGKMLLGLSEAFCVSYAATDELHQLFVPERSGMVTDVVIDAIGALAGILLFIFLLKLKKFSIDKAVKEDYDEITKK